MYRHNQDDKCQVGGTQPFQLYILEQFRTQKATGQRKLQDTESWTPWRPGRSAPCRSRVLLTHLTDADHNYSRQIFTVEARYLMYILYIYGSFSMLLNLPDVNGYLLCVYTCIFMKCPTGTIKIYLIEFSYRFHSMPYNGFHGNDITICSGRSNYLSHLIQIFSAFKNIL